tara:strand:- start:53927 stop:54334 length:408 start_codon:yes stop_codon:yes gene_type:complete
MTDREHDHIGFLEEAAKYFETRSTGGEDRAYWANVYNALNCRLVAERIYEMITPERHYARVDELLRANNDNLERRRQAERENSDLKNSVIAFAGPYAVTYAKERGWPDGELAAIHYDILEAAGARMVSFKRRGDL